jgi:pectate lyase
MRTSALVAVLFGWASVGLAADGFASVNGTVTGGAGGAVVTVTNSADFVRYATGTEPYTIRVQGAIAFNTAAVRSHKTIVGVGSNATLVGELQINGVSNIVVQNLFITNPGPAPAGTGDGVRIYNGAHHIWVDHCSFYDCSDGLCDITTGADYVTVSWCKFYYVQQTLHRFSMLVAASDTDAGQYRITLHHNWWAQGCDQRMPMSRYGTIHLYNNYFSATNNSYCSNARTNAQFLSENNFYAGVDDPLYKTSNGRIRTAGNIYQGCTGLIDAGADTIFSPPYSYALDPATDVPALVQAGAGARGPRIIPERRADALRLWWPADHTGWHLEAQSPASDWMTVAGSSATNEILIPLATVPGSHFFRLVFR